MSGPARRLLTVIAAVGVLLALPSMAFARAEVIERVHDEIPLFIVLPDGTTTTSIFVSCAAGGEGELVDFAGMTLQLKLFVLSDGRGSVHYHLLINPAGVTGVGQTTGDVYQGTGMYREASGVRTGEDVAFVSNFRIIGPGPSNNYLEFLLVRTTVTPAGEITASIDRSSITCR
jgi:hypothetical protein